MIFNLSKTNNKKNLFVTLDIKNIVMLLTLDVGNTRIKAAVFEQTKLVEIFIFTKEEFLDKTNYILNQYQNIKKYVVASVGNLEKELLSLKTKLNFIYNTRK